jgi:hypothetical protein
VEFVDKISTRAKKMLHSADASIEYTQPLSEGVKFNSAPLPSGSPESSGVFSCAGANMPFSGKLSATDILDIEDALEGSIAAALEPRFEKLNSMVDRLASRRPAPRKSSHTSTVTVEQYAKALKDVATARVEYMRPDAERDIERYQRAQAAKDASPAFTDPAIEAYQRAVAQRGY